MSNWLQNNVPEAVYLSKNLHHLLSSSPSRRNACPGVLLTSCTCPPRENLFNTGTTTIHTFSI